MSLRRSLWHLLMARSDLRQHHRCRGHRYRRLSLRGLRVAPCRFQYHRNASKMLVNRIQEHMNITRIAHCLTIRERPHKVELYTKRGFARLSPAALGAYWLRRAENDPALRARIEAMAREFSDPANRMRWSACQGTPQAAPSAGRPLPTAAGMAQNLARSIARWVSQGLPLASEEALQARLAICSACVWWDPAALAGTGRCRKCGCSTQAKLRLATEKCPIDKWGPV